MRTISSKSKKGAMEMSVGTIVTIVLLMTVLILGLFLVRTIFKSSVENIEGIDQAIKNEINKLFAEDASRPIVVYPSSRYITIKKGTDNLGFGFAIRNTGEEVNSFTYDLSAVEASCGMNLNNADKLITLGKTRSAPGISLPAGSFMDDPVFVRFSIPDTAPPCKIRYSVQVNDANSGGTVYATIDVDLEIKSE